MGDNKVNHARAVGRVGQRHGMILILEWIGSDKNRRAVFRCMCDCGKECEKKSIALKSTASCGCYGRKRQSEGRLLHGHSKRNGNVTGIYHSWQSMHSRCKNPNNKDFKWYGGKGVSVCDRWGDFRAFLSDMESGWYIGATIDRVDSDGNYNPDNCRWIDREENARRAQVEKSALNGERSLRHERGRK